MDEAREQKKRRGRPSGKNFIRYTVTLDPEDAEWARDEPEQLSGILRECLSDVRRNRLAYGGSAKKFWKLGAHPKKDGEKFYIWENPHARCAHGFVVLAETEQVARWIAGTHAGEEGGYVWEDPEKTWCDELVPYGQQGLVLGYYVESQ